MRALGNHGKSFASSRYPEPFLVGIAGGTGAGKGLLAGRLVEIYARVGAARLDQDSYYRDRSHLSEAERSLVNYDEPGAVDHELLLRHLQRLLKGVAVEKPRYSFVTHTRSTEGELVDPVPVIVVEGLFTFWDYRVRSLLHLKVYVEADPDIRFIRRLRRDVFERGRTVESVIDQYLQTVRPMHRLYVGPTKAFADLVVDNTSSVEDAVAVVNRAIASRWQHYATFATKADQVSGATRTRP